MFFLLSFFFFLVILSSMDQWVKLRCNFYHVKFYTTFVLVKETNFT